LLSVARNGRQPIPGDLWKFNIISTLTRHFRPLPGPFGQGGKRWRYRTRPL